MHVVVVGSGIAGLTAAIRASRRHDVTLITKGALADAATSFAQGGVAVALGSDDEVALHIGDTLRAGADAADRRAVELLCSDGPARVRDLLSLGVPFDRTTDAVAMDRYGDDLARGREAAHSRWRVIHADGDATGAAIERTLIAAVQQRNLSVFEHTCLTDLVLRDGAVVGVRVLDLLGEPATIDADAVILATGGVGQLYRWTTNPLVATADGVAAAWRAGAAVADLEFVQFHPTRLATDRGGLISEAVRGEGAVLLDEHGQRFMTTLHPDAELAPRDVVARGIAAAMQRQDGRPVMLDAVATGIDLPKRFPGLTRATRDAGFDWTREPIPVAPAEHYAMGGVATDADGRTSLPGLSAVGETACTGVHGANRLASNSLLEGLVFAVRAADTIDAPRPPSVRLRGIAAPTIVELADAPGSSRRGVPDGPVPSSSRRTLLQDRMERHVGLLRTGAGLAAVRAELEAMDVPEPTTVHDAEDRALVTVGRLVAIAAEARRESRGAHARADYPDLDTAAAGPRFWTRSQADIRATAASTMREGATV